MNILDTKSPNQFFPNMGRVLEKYLRTSTCQMKGFRTNLNQLPSDNYSLGMIPVFMMNKEKMNLFKFDFLAPLMHDDQSNLRTIIGMGSQSSKGKMQSKKWGSGLVHPYDLKKQVQGIKSLIHQVYDFFFIFFFIFLAS